MRNKDFPYRVGILTGGDSAEREIALRSGEAVLAALHQARVDAVWIDIIAADWLSQLQDAKVDIACNMVHGGWGEDGVLPAVLEVLRIPYTGSGVIASATAMQKYLSKLLWRARGLPVLPGILTNDYPPCEEFAKQQGYPLALKPNTQGSSVGVSRVTEPGELRGAFDQAGRFGSVLVEPWMDGAEHTIAIVGNTALPLIRIEPAFGEFYDYQAKYHSKHTHYHHPCGLDTAQESDIQHISLQAFQAIGARDWGRIDGIMDAQGNFYLLELNTVPGMTATSLVPKAAQAAGIDFTQLIITILNGALKRSGKI